MSRRAGICGAAVLLATACEAPEKIDVGLPPEHERPTYAALAEKQNARVALLQDFYAGGVIEITWVDEDGDPHTDQGDLDLWVRTPTCLALRVSKLGEDFFWLGCDTDEYWMFDLTDDDAPRLFVGPHETFARDLAGQPLAVAPWSLLDLLGLTPLPETDDPPEVGWDAEREMWTVQTSDGVHMWLHATSHLPLRVELVDDVGRLQACCEHYERRYASVEQSGMSVLDWPKLSTLADITDERGEQSLKVGLSDPTGIVDDQPFDRICDLERLKRAFRPVEIVDNR